MIENWKPATGVYEVSDQGNVRNRKTGRLLKQVKNKDGYLQVGLREDGKSKSFRVHRLVAFAFIPNPDNLPQVNHKNEDKTDNRVENLEWCDAKYNSNYGTHNKRVSNGVRNWWGKTSNLPGVKDKEKFFAYLKEHRIVHKNYVDNYYLKNKNNENN